MKDIKTLLTESDTLLSQLRGVEQEANRAKKEIAAKEKRTEKKIIKSGKGYEYVYNDKGKPVPKGRLLMEKKIGRSLHDHEVVMFRDGNRENFSDSNLVLGLRAGVSYEMMECAHCHKRAGWLINGINADTQED